ncbi:hypothetical protein [Virgibacillus pantothenticus]|nr:hypothetical protein [Virgibacillus pantothenticus]MEB5454229.1 hypothetical protein [Virgibacillus pantothenticus]MEB5458462.1 hypothetical protein [Virgibacillus pantothenticus]MEB5462639.1 hypothetical protein [Virgibacillus pantothenticus]MEB5466815.1 hypothetical protein [Virgibacillus pantothenticus]MEB5471053.1 hypothetical protein [Virgibacillus pantothenticus]
MLFDSLVKGGITGVEITKENKWRELTDLAKQFVEIVQYARGYD